MYRLVGTVKMSLVSQLYSSPLMTSVADRGFIMTAPTHSCLSPPCRNALLPPAEHLLIPAPGPDLRQRAYPRFVPITNHADTADTGIRPVSRSVIRSCVTTVLPVSSSVSDDRVSSLSSPCPADDGVSDDVRRLCVTTVLPVSRSVRRSCVITVLPVSRRRRCVRRGQTTVSQNWLIWVGNDTQW